MKKAIAVLLSCLILTGSILLPVKEAKAILPVAIPLAAVSPEIMSALLTLIGGGLIVHTTDAAIAAAKEYHASGHPTGTISGGKVLISSAAAAAASTWLSTWTTSLVQSTTVYSQTIGNTFPQTPADQLDWATGGATTMISEFPITRDGISTIEIVGWPGIQSWIEGQTGEWPDDARTATFNFTSTGSAQYFEVKFTHDWITIDWNGGMTIVSYPFDLSSVEKIRFFLNRYLSDITGALTLDVGIQVWDGWSQEWQFPSDAPVIGDMNPDGVSLQLDTDTTMPVSTTLNLPLSYGPGDITYDPATPSDMELTIPTDWDGVIDKTADQMQNPETTDPPVDPTLPTSILDWLAKLWAWIQEFWAWLKNLPNLLISLLKNALKDLFIPTAMTSTALSNLSSALMTHAPFAWVGQSFTMLQRITAGMNSNSPPALQLPIIGTITEIPVTVGWVEKIRSLTTFLIWASLLVFGYKQYRSLIGGGGSG